MHPFPRSVARTWLTGGEVRSRAESPRSRTACISRALGALCFPVWTQSPSSGGASWLWQATSPPQDRMRSRARTISQTGGRRLGPWNRLRMRASACRAEPERGVEKGVEGHWDLAIKARPFRRNGAGRTARGGQEKEKKPYPHRRSHRPYPERTAPASNSP